MPTFPRPRPLIAILAMGRNGAIGYCNQLPWTMPSDLARFRALTMGKPMIMGRRTFESIGRVLPGRESIVVSQRRPFEAPAGVHIVADPREAVRLAHRRADAMAAGEIALIGGAQLFAALMDDIDTLYLTVIDLSPKCDVALAWPDPFDWQEVARHRPPRDPRDDADSVHLEYRRAKPRRSAVRL